MDFDFTPEQIQLRKAVREFAESEIRPHVMEWDEAQIFPLEVVKKLGTLGYLGAIVAAHTSLCSNHIFKMGSDEQRRRYTPKLASGEWIGCWSLTEPEAGSDAAGTRTTATLEGEQWTINGSKTFTTNAHYA